MSEQGRSIRFAAVLCLACSLLLTSAAMGLKGFQEKNALVDKHKNILKSVGLIDDDRPWSHGEIETLFAEKIQASRVDESGCIMAANEDREGTLPIYLYTEEEKIRAYILPIDTRGLWGKIKGYLAVAEDGATITGFTVFSHAETPGLGGEIEKRWFQKNFVGKKIVDQAGEFVSISIAKGKVGESVSEKRRANMVDGISGATLTGKFLTAGLKSILSDYEPVSVRFRANTLSCDPEKVKKATGKE